MTSASPGSISADHSASLPAGPAGFQRIGWHGQVFIVPTNWNLQLHHGNAKSGSLFFSDLHAVRLEVRWQSLNPFTRRLLRRMVGRMTRSGRATWLSATAVRIAESGATRVILVEGGFERGRRLCELKWPGCEGNGEGESEIVHDFLEMQALLRGREEQYWSMYGAQGWLPARARLRKVSLLPGATRLAFRQGIFGKRMELGAFSMADRLLADFDDLKTWATRSIPLVGRFPEGRWEESRDAALFVAESRQTWRTYQLRLTLRHDREANRIGWTHCWERV